MEVSDPDTIGAYYMFVNHGWKPTDWTKMSIKERALMLTFIAKEMQSRKEMEAKIGRD